MLQNRTRALAQPQHIFDVAAYTAHGLARVGAITIRLAHAIDSAAVARRSSHQAEAKVRPRDRLGPREFDRAAHDVTDAWRVR